MAKHRLLSFSFNAGNQKSLSLHIIKQQKNWRGLFRTSSQISCMTHLKKTIFMIHPLRSDLAVGQHLFWVGSAPTRRISVSKRELNPHQLH